MQRAWIPNSITISRGIACGLIIALFFSSFSGRYYAVFGLLLYAALTDYVDGFLARRWHVTSAFGEMSDPLFDKIIVISLLVLLYPFNVIPAPAVIILIVRDLAIDSLRSFTLRKTGATTPAILSAKWKTVLQLITLLAATALLAWPATEWLKPAIQASAWLAVAAALWSAGRYLTTLWPAANAPAISPHDTNRHQQ